VFQNGAAAAAAERLSRRGKVAVLDLDFHHGNGTQEIFWRRDDVLTISIHVHPSFSYPYFSGFAGEVGEGRGKGFNRNFPLPERAGEKLYLDALRKALTKIERFHAMFLVVSMGFGTMTKDPTGSFSLTAKTMERIGRSLGNLNLATLEGVLKRPVSRVASAVARDARRDEEAYQWRDMATRSNPPAGGGRPAATRRDAAPCDSGLRCASSWTLSIGSISSARLALSRKSRRRDRVS